MPTVASVKNKGKGISPLMKGDSPSKRTLGAENWGFLAVYGCRFLICYLHSHPLSNCQKINSFAIILRSSGEMTYIDWTTWAMSANYLKLKPRIGADLTEDLTEFS